MYPTSSQIEALHRKYAPSEKVFDLVYAHCRIVWEIAEQLMNGKSLHINLPLLQAGALLHDIGAYKFITGKGIFDEKNYIRHTIEGFLILKNEKLPEELCLIAKNHIGVGITKNEIEQNDLPLPSIDLIAETNEEKLIMYADKFHSKNSQFNTFESYRIYISRFGKEKVEKFDELEKLFGKPDLKNLSEKYNMPIV